MSREGPDAVDMMVATWCNIALPSILFGTEMVPFTEATILELERAQNQVAKYALGLPISTPGVCAQVELGLKPVRQLLYENQLKFYTRVLQLEDTRWVKQALLDHISQEWDSPYFAHILELRSKLGLFEIPLKTNTLLKKIEKIFISSTNSTLSSLSLPWIMPITCYKRVTYVRESSYSTTLSEFRYNMPPIGHKYPRVGRLSVRRLCPLCPTSKPNTASHLAFFCPYIERVRKEETSLSFFRNICSTKGFTEDRIFQLFVSGLDWNENPVQADEFLDRGRELKHVMDAWLDKW